MPHQCTNCGRTFADGSKEMLSGCPDCSGTKFQYSPDGFDGTDDTSSFDDAADSGRSGDSNSRDSDGVSRKVGSAAATVRDFVSGSSSPESQGDDDIIVADSEPVGESDAQADARSGFAGPDEVPDRTGVDRDDDADTPLSTSTGTGASSDTGTGTGASSDTGTGTGASSDTGTGTGASSDSQETVPADAERSVAEEPDAERAEGADIDDLRAELNEQFESIRVVEPGQYELNLMELYDREEYIIALQEDGRYTIQVPETWRDADV